MHKTRNNIAAIFLGLCLLLLTGINFLVYAGDDLAMVTMAENECWDDNSAPAPIEEKAPETNSSSPLIEEYLHDVNQMNVNRYNLLVLRGLEVAHRLQIVSPELVSPPPEQLNTCGLA